MSRKMLLAVLTSAAVALATGACGGSGGGEVDAPGPDPDPTADAPAEEPPAGPPAEALCDLVPLDVVTRIGNLIPGRGPASEPRSGTARLISAPGATGMVEVTGDFVECEYRFDEPENALLGGDGGSIVITYALDAGPAGFEALRQALTDSNRLVGPIPGAGDEAFLARTLSSTAYARKGAAVIVVDGLLEFDDQVVQDLAREVTDRL